MAAKKRLGRGLDALIPRGAEATAIREIPVDSLKPNPRQPRRRFSKEEIVDLATSIREHGILQPLVVRPAGKDFEVVAGERRLLAAREAGLKKVPCIVRRVDDEMLLPLALVENLQREDLNAVEEAEAFKILAEDYGLSHDAIAHAVAKSRTAVTNTLRLLDLAAPVLAMIEEGKLTAGQARPLLAVSPKSRQIALARRITREGLSAREAEALAAAAVKGDPAPGRRESPAQPYVDDLARRLEKLLGTKVVITGSGRRGSIKIQYFNKEDLNRLSDKLLNRSS